MIIPSRSKPAVGSPTPDADLNRGPDTATSLHDEWLGNRLNYMSNIRAAAELVRKANRVGEHFLALDIIDAAAKGAPGKRRIFLIQQKALALARSGSGDQALKILKKLRSQSPRDGETLGLLGRIYKDQASVTGDRDQQKALWSEAQQFYLDGLKGAHSAYCGINASALAVLLGDLEGAQKIARSTLRAPKQNDVYYDLATAAEANLILKEEEKAAELYRQACAYAGGKWADVASTKKQCRLLAAELYGSRNKFDDCFPSGGVGIFAGHIADGPDRPCGC